MKLDELSPAVANQTRRRVGRGVGSGLGKTSGKGHKGQKARSGGGVRRGFEGGQTPLYRRLPKRGFTNIHAKNYVEVTLTMLNQSKATEVSAETLLAENIISKVNDGIVVLATGNLDKKLTVKAKRFTKTAAEKIEAGGGMFVVILLFNTFKNALKTPEVRKKLLYTLVLIIVFRLGCFITIPGVDAFALNEAMGSANGIAGLINIISGGAFSRFSIFAMTISPYITASIVIQLLAMVIPALERIAKEGGEEGRQKMNKYTKILTIVLAIVESLGIYLSYKSSGIFVNPGFLTGMLVVLSLVAGTALLMWLGEQITNKGIGNGISIIIFIGIVSSLPSVATTLWGLVFSGGTFSSCTIF